VEPLIAIEPELPLPDVPAVALVEPALGAAPGVEVDPGADVAAPLDAVEPALPGVDVPALEPPDPMRALVSMNWPLLERVVLAAAPVVPLVPVAPAVLPPPERQPVTVIARLLLDV
jgi:hypothetical protein